MWEDLEEKIKRMFKKDLAKRTPGSGNSKKEEDVVGRSTIIQCKYSEDKNISIHKDDIDRVVAAASLQGKTPIFVTKNRDTILLSILDGDMMEPVIHFILAKTRIKKVKEELQYCTTLQEFEKLSTEAHFIETELLTVAYELKNEMKDLNNSFKIKYDDLTTINLFE